MSWISADHGLFAEVGFDVLVVRAEPIAELDIPDPFAVRTLVTQSIARAFADGFALPLTHCGHYVQHQPARSRAGIERLGNRNQRHSPPLKEFKQFTKVLNAAREPIELGDNDGAHVASIN